MSDIDNKLVQKWQPLLENENMPPIVNSGRRTKIATMLENQDKIMTESAASTTTNVANYDKLMMQVARRSAPSFLHFDLLGVQPMNGRTGVVFALRSNYVDTPSTISSTPGQAGTPATLGDEANFNAPDTGNSGTGTQDGLNPFDGLSYTTGTAMDVETAETSIASEMALSIEKTTVTAKNRQLRAGLSLDLKQDLQAVHGIDGMNELTNVLSTTLTTETNYELLRTIYGVSVTGSPNTTTPGTFDVLTDSTGRFGAEHAQMLWFHIQKECNRVGKAIRSGKANWLIGSADTVAYLALGGLVTWADKFAQGFDMSTVDVTGATYVGSVFGLALYIDPYVEGDGFVVGYKGSDLDAGMYFAPYGVAQMYEAMDSRTFSPVLGIRRSYAIAANPFVETGMAANSNPYYRKTQVTNI